jgi:ribosome-binding ATPase
MKDRLSPGATMHVGICGYPGSGKSTVFSALAPGARADKEVAFGVIKVPDERVDRLVAIFKPKKVNFSEITFVDVAGESGAATGVFPPRVIQHMRNADVLAHVVRGFESTFTGEAPEPERDERLFGDELLLLDLGILEKRVARLKKEGKKGAEVEVAERCVAHLEAGQPLRTLDLAPQELETLVGIQLLSQKPLAVLYNLSEAAWDDPVMVRFRDLSHPAPKTVHLGLCGTMEADIAAMPPAEQREFLDGLGLGEPVRNTFIREAYRLLDLISFLTSGPDECRSWPIHRGTVARRAAGKVHSDIERGFIRAEVYRVEELESVGTEAALKSQGRIRVEGKDYVIQDGDVVNFRFNV